MIRIVVWCLSFAESLYPFFSLFLSFDMGGLVIYGNLEALSFVGALYGYRVR